MTAIATAAMAAPDRTCRDDETPEDCLNRLEEELKTNKDAGSAALEAKARSDVKEDVFSKTTGPDLSGSTLASTIKDLIPLFRVGAESGELGNDNPSAGVDLNLDLFGEKDRDLQIRAVLNEASLFEPLRMALPEATREERSEALEKTLDDMDDYSIVLTWNHTSPHFGRNIETESRMFSELIGRANTKWTAFRRKDEAVVLGRMLQALDIDDTSSFSKIAQDAGPEKALEVDQAVVAAFEGEIERDALVKKEAEDTKFFRFADLINNQPQIHVTIERRSRGDLAGPDETSLKVTYEKGFHNVNTFRKWCKSNGKSEDLACLQSYLSTREPGLESGNRVSFSLEASKADDYDITLPDDMVSLDLEFERKIKGTLAYGRYLVVDEAGHDKARVDLSASYEEFGDDARQDRSVASLTYTQKVTDSVSFVFGLSWANKEEFLSETDDRINAHLGLSYKLLGPDTATDGGE